VVEDHQGAVSKHVTQELGVANSYDTWHGMFLNKEHSTLIEEQSATDVRQESFRSITVHYCYLFHCCVCSYVNINNIIFMLLTYLEGCDSLWSNTCLATSHLRQTIRKMWYGIWVRCRRSFLLDSNVLWVLYNESTLSYAKEAPFLNLNLPALGSEFMPVRGLLYMRRHPSLRKTKPQHQVGPCLPWE